jgi:hypothetical protein
MLEIDCQNIASMDRNPVGSTAGRPPNSSFTPLITRPCPPNLQKGTPDSSARCYSQGENTGLGRAGLPKIKAQVALSSECTSISVLRSIGEVSVVE